VLVSKVSPDGRAALSQGLISTAARQANRTAKLLSQFIADGRDVIVVEPSVLSMFRLDYRHLLSGAEAQLLFQQLSRHSFDSVEYLWQFLLRNAYRAAERFPASRHPQGIKIFYHSHCQQKTVGSAEATPALLRAAGFDVVTSEVECCGMAGSFGYKKEFYELSMAVGQDLLAQIRKSEAEIGPRLLVATGTSCQEQLRSLLNRPALHPMELLAGVV
jgi:Fe-S oxidoreductase